MENFVAEKLKRFNCRLELLQALHEVPLLTHITL